ncbi:MAG: hypothetical protein P8076_09075 [Gammaproteobacteria bacterium]|jgi:hypothetical protein
MSKQRLSNSTFGGKALEMIMRDVLDGMADLAIMQSWESDWGEFEVLGSEPVGCPDIDTHSAAAGKHQPEPIAAATVVELKPRGHHNTHGTLMVGKKIAGPRA